MPRFSENQVHHACIAATARVVHDARVLIVGRAGSGIGEAALDAGARFVHVFDPTRGAPATPSALRRGLVVSRLPEGDFDAREGSFDVALILVNPDDVVLAAAEQVIRGAKRVVKHDGAIGVVLSGALPDTDPPYLGLYDELGMHFGNVQVFGVFPWSGVAVAELGETEADDVAIEGSQTTSPSIRAYVILATPDVVEVPSYSLVEIAAFGDEEDEAPTPSDAVDAATFAELKLQAELLAAQLEEQRLRSTHESGTEATLIRRIDEADKFLKAEQERAERLVENQRKLDAMLNEAQRELRRVTDELSEEHRARKKLELEKQLLKEEIEQLSAWKPPQVHVLTPERRDDIEMTVAVRGDELASLAGHAGVPSTKDVSPNIDDTTLRRRLDDAETKAGDLGRAFEAERDRSSRFEKALDGHADAHGAEISELESKLEERGKRLAELSRELVDKTRIAEDLVARLVELEDEPSVAAQGGGVGGDADEGKLRAMAVDLAKFEGELRSREWRIQELESQLREREVPRDAEVAELRQALAREHEARRKAEGRAGDD